MSSTQKFPYTWHEAIDILRNDPKHKDLIYNSYLSKELIDNAKRFKSSGEFQEVLKIINNLNPNARTIMDMPGGNGIATYAFAFSGYEVTTVEPDDSDDVGRGAIEFVLQQSNLKANVIEAYGENLPFKDSSFDIIYVRQGLHHANNLKKMLQEISRVLAPNGILIATREHVVDNYDDSLDEFLNSQVDHLLYGGENAFILSDYISSIKESGLSIINIIKPYSSIINLFPYSSEELNIKILNSSFGKILLLFLPKKYVIGVGLWYLNRKKIPGRLYSFIAKKS
jgi:ubiquinone/menaquinone biosynthesis C-methylase UbiE